ncbi:MAG: 3-dehydroquinate synthase [Coriobacteriales bacterium]|jgi:3-dehydroquinate synthase|nr:3-dehydroquinate synthase [Coriobacteriales bacterium]
MSTRRLRVVLEQGQVYDIRVGHRLLTNLGVHLREASGASKATKAVVITDSNTGPLYLAQVKAGLEKANFEAFDLTIPAGEASKGIDVAHELWEALAYLGLGRDGVIVALGGGVVGDIAGFVASTYMRGIDCVQVPTSLLAMVDSSIGGKTAINLDGGKNLVGTFKQPAYVAADLATLATLPADEWENGFAEIAKSALVDSAQFTQWLVDNAAGLVAHDEAIVQEAIVQSLTFKARVVAHDELEKGLRECLNYGHTFAHALESVAGYGVISHGRAVAEGMRFAARLAIEAIAAPQEFANAQDALLDKLGLTPITTPYAANELFERMFSDKKVRNSELRFVLATAPGTWETVVVDPDLVKIYLILWEQARM